ncbi:MAG: LPXTG cell wall anchor domain-containing protein [Bifidobacteriaceae bacterium]|jgi:adhesin isopeptide-forming family sspB-C2 type protein|nr:LPXTG cell wall anchor domain-containing protein [Bifidobacteriaceae bacterium]MCI1914395.1 LPXTG cell wall anchor domain-containing protein [Bifidobacteriaceae bacterium]MCI1935847.1 LPXTG cell wall anchor domain-containing protein [Bifidobacteriaceae bacterium]
MRILSEKHGGAKAAKRSIAVAVAAATLFSGLTLASAAGTGDGTGGGGDSEGATGNGQGQGQVDWWAADNLGAPTAANAAAVLESHGIHTATDGPAALQESTSEALAQCEARYKASGAAGKANCRLFAIGVVHTPGTQWGDMFNGHTADLDQLAWLTAYNNQVASKGYKHKGVAYKTTDTFSDGKTTINSMAAEHTAGGRKSSVIIVLAQNEPQKISSYDLSVSTKQAGGFTKAGGTAAVHDMITTSNSLKKNENVKATAWLNWDGYTAKSTVQKKASKAMTLKTNKAGQASPSFKPSDFGWTEWPAGRYWYDVVVAKQGGMSKKVDTANRVKAESWTSTPPTPTKVLTDGNGKDLDADSTLAAGDYAQAVVGAHSSGAEDMWLSDTVYTKDIYFGSATKDDTSRVYVTDPNGKKVAATISVDDSVAGQRTVMAHVDTNTTMIGNYQLHVPEYAKATGKDYTVPDTGRVCYAQAGSNCQNTDKKIVPKKTPTPDKAWVLDAKGALTTSDEGWTNTKGVDTKTFVPGMPVSAVVNGRFPKGLVHDLNSYTITDDWTSAAKYVDFTDASRARVYVDGVDRTGVFDIKTVGTTTVATAKPEELKGTAGLAKAKSVKLVVSGSFRSSYSTNAVTVKLTNGGSETWNNEKRPTNDPPVFTWTPVLDKSWIKKSAGGKWISAIDPSKSNTTGADNQTFLDGDTVASTINGLVPANLGEAPDNLTFVDDYVHVDYLVDPVVSGIKVYAKDVTDTTKSTVTDILTSGTDVTSMFTIAHSGTKITVTAKPEYLKTLTNLAKGKQITTLIPFTVNYANGGGAKQVRTDFGKADGDEVTFCVNPDQGKAGSQKLVNAATETIEEGTAESNQPGICGYVPPVKKTVVSEASQGGDQSDINGKGVMPGQKVEYELTTNPQIPAALGYDITKVQFVDQFDEYVTPSKQTLEITDLGTGRVIPKTAYTTTWDDAKHSFVATFSDAYVQANWNAGSNPRVLVRFEVTVNTDAPVVKNFDNTWDLVLNHSITPSNVVTNKPVDPKPTKQDTQDDASINIDGQNALLGDKLVYRLNLDASDLTDSAYLVKRLGMVDDYDNEYLKALTDEVKVLDAQGNDVTAKFNIQDKDGVLYAFFKTVDTTIPATGETVKGNPQPTDLKAYSAKKLDQKMYNKQTDDYETVYDPAIDQSVLGQDYQVVLPVKVKKVTDGYVVKNTATQVTNNQSKITNTVTNPLKELNPKKDVVVNVGDESANNKSIYLNHTFLYGLDSSIIPASRAYPKVTDWSLVDDYDQSHDQYTGQWAVYATNDVLDASGTVVAKKGDMLASSSTAKMAAHNDWFTFVEKDGVFSLKASQSYLDLVSANNTGEQSWRLYVQMTRIKTGDVVNAFDETLNGVVRHSNQVKTHTPDSTPSIDLEKFDVKSGLKKGDRDKTSQALTVKGDTKIGFKITNTGRATLGKIKLDDKTIAGSGTVEKIEYPDDWDTLELKPGESVTVYGVLKGVRAGDHHTDRAHVTGQPKIQCPVIDKDPFDGVNPTADESKTCWDTPVEDTDDWNGVTAEPVKPTPLAATGTDLVMPTMITLVLGALGIASAIIVRRPKAAAVHAAGKGGAHKA